MPYFYHEGALEPGAGGEMKGSELKHARLSRKIRVDEEIQLQDSNDRRFLVRVEAVKNNFLGFRVLREIPALPEPELKISVYVAPIKEKPLDWVLQKCTELGAANIFLFPSAYSNKLPNPPTLANRLERWQRICREACKQCERRLPPHVGFFRDFRSAAEHSLEQNGRSLMLHHLGSGGNRLPEPAGFSSLGMFVGPEGGFTEEEAGFPGFERIKLGPRVMKAETAVIAGLSVLQHLYGDFRAEDPAGKTSEAEM